mmetsp:Transcript_123527/g.395129  ORF Transcript_123527/g.395129 Transcript_123527/m.395129 type:complete len:237 (+) Transcript_123527:4343-5053(+)
MAGPPSRVLPTPCRAAEPLCSCAKPWSFRQAASTTSRPLRTCCRKSSPTRRSWRKSKMRRRSRLLLLSSQVRAASTSAWRAASTIKFLYSAPRQTGAASCSWHRSTWVSTSGRPSSPRTRPRRRRGRRNLRSRPSHSPASSSSSTRSPRCSSPWASRRSQWRATPSANTSRPSPGGCCPWSRPWALSPCAPSRLRRWPRTVPCSPSPSGPRKNWRRSAMATVKVCGSLPSTPRCTQ